MPKQYTFEIWRAGKKPCTYYSICANEPAALAWIDTQAKIGGWGVIGFDWQIKSLTSRPLSQVYEDDGDKAGYLCEIVEEIFARDCSNNCPNAEFRGLSYIDLCEAAIEILEVLKKRRSHKCGLLKRKRKKYFVLSGPIVQEVVIDILKL